jgi:small subunit ribosomal protein S8
MSMTDPISDMLARIKNAQAVRKKVVAMPASKVKAAIATVLRDEGFIRGFDVTQDGVKSTLTIERLERVSKPGRRQYFRNDELPRVLNGLGIAIVSTSGGVMTDAKARSEKRGGEVICLVA